MAIVDGIEDDAVVKTKTQAFQSWFFKIEFIDCLTVLTKDTMFFLGAKDKVIFLEFLTPLFAKHNKKIIFLTKEKGKADLSVRELIDQLKAKSIQTIGTIQKEKQKGETADAFTEALKQFSHLDISAGVEQCIAKKFKVDIELLKTTSQAVGFFA